MAVTSALVLLAVVWWMVFFVVLPLRLTTQDEAGEVVDGTPRSAPVNPQMRRKVRLTTLWSLAIWAVLCTIIATDTITVRDFDWRHQLPPVEAN